MYDNSQGDAGQPRGLLKENIAVRLREEILAGRIAPGEKIVESRWARQYGVAQVSIREALNILTTDGFVTKGHGRSARVLELADLDIIHIYQVRGALEGLAARIVAQRRLPLDDLEAALQSIEEAVQMGDLRKVVETGITPRINTGILHACAGTGQVGAGVAVAPIECFRDALLALDRRFR